MAVHTGDAWLLHCGDAYVWRGQIDPDHAVGSRPRWIEPLARRLFPHAPRLRALLCDRGDEVHLFCAHDSLELAG